MRIIYVYFHNSFPVHFKPCFRAIKQNFVNQSLTNQHVATFPDLNCRPNIQHMTLTKNLTCSIWAASIPQPTTIALHEQTTLSNRGLAAAARFLHVFVNAIHSFVLLEERRLVRGPNPFWIGRLLAPKNYRWIFQQADCRVVFPFAPDFRGLIPSAVTKSHDITPLKKRFFFVSSSDFLDGGYPAMYV